MTRWTGMPRSEGETSRQAHVDLPKNTYERELGREGFFGPATQMYHRHPPTGWTNLKDRYDHAPSILPGCPTQALVFGRRSNY